MSEKSTQKAYHCTTCGKPMQAKTGKMGPFWGCSGFPDCKTTLNDVDGKPSREIDELYRCPICTRRMIKASPEKGNYWYCSGFARGCKIQIADDNGQPEASWRCPECGNLLKQRQGKNGVFWGCTHYPNCRATFKDQENKPVL